MVVVKSNSSSSSYRTEKFCESAVLAVLVLAVSLSMSLRLALALAALDSPIEAMEYESFRSRDFIRICLFSNGLASWGLVGVVGVGGSAIRGSRAWSSHW